MGPTLKLKHLYTCRECSSEYVRWQGRCDQCQAWNTLDEHVNTGKKSDKNALKAAPIPLTDVSIIEEQFIPSGVLECDTVLGKGFVKGSVSLIGGEPGIGKSTLSLQIALHVASQGLSVLYISAEESINQLLLRARRLGPIPKSLLVYTDPNMQAIQHTIEKGAFDFIILDSIQVVFHPDLPSIPGSVNQVRHCANEFIRFIKQTNSTGLLIGHITKDGHLAGPKVLEHLVDVILYFEGERHQRFRLLRSFKNRYAATNEIGLFEMKPEGLISVSNPSQLFIDDTTLTSPGSAVSALIEGSRVFLVEVQALVVSSGYGMAKRTYLGVDPNRANLLIAAMEKILNLRLSNMDIILNVIGSLKINEQALDLAIVCAILSSINNRRLPLKIAIWGEVGLTGEIRPVPQAEKRLNECLKLGFLGALLPKNNQKLLSSDGQMKLNYVTNIKDLMSFFEQHYVETKD